MTKSIEIIISGDSVTANFNSTSVSLGYPNSLLLGLPRKGEFKLSSQESRRFKIIYTKNIPEIIEKDLHLLSAYLGVKAEITTSNPLYHPNNRDMCQIELPPNVVISINYGSGKN